MVLYKDLSDSAVFLKRPSAAVKTDDWGYFCLPYLEDTQYRLYALKDEAGNNIYDPDTDLVGFVDSLVRPVVRVVDTLPEMLKYDMTDTLMCEARRVDYKLRLFREKPTKQFLVNKNRTADRAAYITFQAPNVWIDSLWFRGYSSDQVISQFNRLHDNEEELNRQSCGLTPASLPRIPCICSLITGKPTLSVYCSPIWNM